MPEWAVTLDAELRKPIAHTHDEIADVVGDLVDWLAEYGAAVSVSPENRVSVTMTVEAQSGPDALSRAQAEFERVLYKLDVEVCNWVAMEVVSTAEQDRRIQEPALPELVGSQEVASTLGVSRQRLSQLRERPDFPRPIARLAAGPIWVKSSLVDFIESWNRQPGRPRRERASIDDSPQWGQN